LYSNDKITSVERAQEILLTSLRLTKGLKIKALLKFTNTDKVESFLNLDNCKMLKNQGFIEMNNSLIKITNKGFPVLNSLISKIIL
jgi:coproporphyrinogen III oxidase-like Fe-S oxidoreductase